MKESYIEMVCYGRCPCCNKYVEITARGKFDIHTVSMDAGTVKHTSTMKKIKKT